MPVVRNPQFYFKEGMCWSDISDTRIRCRIKTKSVHDVKSMSLFSNCSIPEKFIISLINSLLIGHFIKNFVNNTVSFQINDARQLPIIIPNQNELEQIIELANKAIQEKQKGENDIFLNLIQQQVDEFVNNLYNLH